MPELAEIRIMADYINSGPIQEENFTSILFSPSAEKRRMSIVQPSDLQIFKISADSRGKELMLTLHQGNKISMKISCSMGMSGYWKLVRPGQSIPKHSHLLFNSTSGSYLCLIDVRRFAKWKECSTWSSNRGPDPTTEYDKFLENISINKSRRVFNKPVCEILMDQKYFNGIGNYLRAEILYRADINPWTPANVALENQKVLQLCRQVPMEAYSIGGGSIKDWKNPYGEQEISIDSWMQCYGKESSKIDGTGRRIWFNRKFN
jgi:endonuclease VIII-like 1